MRPFESDLFGAVLFDPYARLALGSAVPAGEFVVTPMSRDVAGAKFSGPLLMTGDDHGNTAASATDFALGSTVTGILDTDTDEDWFRVSVEAGKNYSITETFILDSAGASGRFVDATGAELDFTFAMLSDGTNQFIYTADATGSVYFVAASLGYVGDTYSLTLSEVSDDFGATPGTAGNIAPNGAAVAGSIDFGGDTDWFRFDVGTDNTVLFTFQQPNFELQSVSIVLYDADGVKRGMANADDTETERLFADLASGVYFIAVEPFSGTGDYALSIDTVFDAEGSTRANAVAVDVAAGFGGSIDYEGDVDVFSFTLDRTAAFTFTIESGADPFRFNIRDVFGTYEGFSENGVLTLVLQAGDYTMEVVGNAAYAPTGSYTVSASESSDDVVADSSTDRTAEVNGAAVSAQIDYSGDEDWFAFSVVDGQTYSFNIDFFLLADGLELRVVDADGNPVGFVDVFTDPVTLEDFVTYTADRTADLFLVVTASGVDSFRLPLQYSFTIESETVAADDFAADTSTTGVVDLATNSIAGVFETAEDRDWFAIDIAAGEAWLVSGDASLDFRIFDANGVAVSDGMESNTDFFTETSILFNASVGGTYFIEAAPLSFSTATSYSASVSQVPGEGTQTLTIGAATDVIIYGMDDVDEFTVSLEAGVDYFVTVGSGEVTTALLDAAGETVEVFGQADRFTVAQSGEYTLSIAGDALAGLSAQFEIGVYEVPDDESDTAAAATVIGTSVDAFAHGIDDVDAFLVDLSLNPTQAYRVRVGPDSEGRGSDAVVSSIEGVNAVAGRIGQDLTLFFGDASAETGAVLLDLSGDGFYGLTFEAIEDDVAIGTTSDAALDGLISGLIQFSGDTDTYRFTVETPGAYTVSVRAVEGSIFLTGLNQQAVDQDFIEYGLSYTFVFEEPGTLDVEIGGEFLGADLSYEVTAELIPDDHGNTQAFATPIALGDTVSMTPDYRTDRDAVSFLVDEAGAIGLSFAGLTQSPDSVQVLDANGASVEVDVNFDQATFIAEAAGTYTVIYAGAEATELTARAIADDYASGTDTTGVIQSNGFVSGQFEFAGDRDAFRLSVDAGEMITLIADAPNGSLGVSRMAVLDANGSVIDETVLGSTLSFAANAAGEYFVVVDSRAAGLSITGDYTIRAISNVDDYGDGAPGTTFGDLALGGRASGALNGLPDDVIDTDAFSLSLDAGEATLLSGRTTGGVALGIGVFSSDGELLATNVDTSTGEVLTRGLSFTASSSDDYTVLVGAESADLIDTYTVTARALTQGGETDEFLVGTDGLDSVIGGGGNDTLLGDNYVVVDPDSFEGQLFRAYQAVFDRAPDRAGFDLFLGTMRLGINDQAAIIAEFVASPEFQDTYGELSNEAFVAQLYRNALGREADAGGLASFTSALDSGTLSRTDVVVEFANSQELINTSGLANAAFTLNTALNPSEGQIFRLYQAVFDRAPDEAGFSLFVGALQVGALTLEQIADEFVSSPEFQSTYGSLDTAEFVELLFSTVLPGNTDPVGRNAYANALDAGDLTRAEMVLELSQSFEFTAATTPAAIAFVRENFAGNADVIDGGTGDDVMFGGRGPDVYIYDVRDGGEDVVLDFNPETDLLVVRTDGAFFGFDALIAAATQQGTDTVFDFGAGNTLTLRLVDRSELTARAFFSEFVLSAEAPGKATQSDPVSEILDLDVPLSAPVPVEAWETPEGLDDMQLFQGWREIISLAFDDGGSDALF